jgi:hypothetical protein
METISRSKTINDMQIKSVFSFLVRPLKIIQPSINNPIEVVFRKVIPSTKFVIDNKKGLDKLLKDNTVLRINPINLKCKVLIDNSTQMVNVDFKDSLKEQSIQFREILKSKQAEIKEEALNKFNNRNK